MADGGMALRAGRASTIAAAAAVDDALLRIVRAMAQADARRDYDAAQAANARPGDLRPAQP